MANQQVTSNTRLGFIGLGNLGSRIARRLIKAGFPMTVFDRDQDRTKEFESLGAAVAPDPRKLADRVDIVLSCVPDAAAVESIYLGPSGALRTARPGTLIIEMSTVAPKTSRRLSEAAREFGISVLDVAVSGSTVVADAGTLTLLGGGDRDLFDASTPVFASIAKQWFYMGPSGSGVAMKLVVNTLLGLGMQSVAEAVALGSKLGLPREALFDTLAKTAVVSPVQAAKLATAKQNDYAPQFPVRLMNKDFKLILAAAAEAELWMPATERAAAVNSAETAAGGEEDFSAVIRRMEQAA
ncbi:MAG TPA: NAD(P)-dependent oxidoreductase [Bryobacteraceae bacterium]|jgi:3-hydroxyisobutyrate dehydrogenase-like beta-hydroxyacid dehydrogenase|nr:NAD(P)-dependent oxidoreductase [Bryobacteraceae bacterium]